MFRTAIIYPFVSDIWIPKFGFRVVRYASLDCVKIFNSDVVGLHVESTIKTLDVENLCVEATLLQDVLPRLCHCIDLGICQVPWACIL